MTTPQSPLPLEALLAQARARFRARDPACEPLFRAVLKHAPDNTEALDIVARFANHRGDAKEERRLREQLDRLGARSPRLCLALALVRLKTGDRRGGILALRHTVCLDPAHVEATRHLGFLARALNRRADAIRWFSRWFALVPTDVDAAKALSAELLAAKQTTAGARVLKAALRYTPHDAELWGNLGVTLRRAGQRTEAVKALKQAAALDKTDPWILSNLGHTLRDLGQKDEARQAFERLLTLDPKHTDARLTLGAMYKEQGFWHQAETTLEGLAPPPGLTQPGLFLTMARLPMLYRSEAEIEARRAVYAESLERLATPLPATASPEEVTKTAGAVASTQPYYLPYQNRNDRPLQEVYGRMVHAAMTRAYPDWAQPPAVTPPAPGEPVRVGLVAGFFRWHTIWKLFLRGWMTGLDPARLQITAYSTHAAVDDTTREARAGFPCFVDHLPFEVMARRIRDDQNHVLIWPEIGMDSMAARLACLRLAPVQCVSWGHPDTTGLPSMDWFLTSDFMEPEGAEAVYSETLHKLPNLGIAYPPLPEPHEDTDFTAMGLPQGATVFLCCQFLSKYLPQYDSLLARIAAQVPGAKFAFIDIRRPPLKALLQERLHAAFAAEGVSADDHIVFLPYLKPGAYAALNDRADVYLDTIGWSGGNTTLEAVAHGLPVVTLPGTFMRGRHSAAILRQIGVTDTIAASEDEYVALAVRLGTDTAWRAEIGARVKAGCPRIYDDTAPLRALEDFVDAVARGRTPPVHPSSW